MNAASAATNEPTPLHIELNAPEYDAAFSRAPIYRKRGIVYARDAHPGERVATVIPNKWASTEYRETESRPAVEGDKVVCNPGGGTYLMDADTFARRYEEWPGHSAYRAKARVRVIRNPTGRPVVNTAPWGEPMHGSADCFFLAATDDHDQPTHDRYLHDPHEFNEGYGPAQDNTAQVTELDAAPPRENHRRRYYNPWLGGIQYEHPKEDAMTVGRQQPEKEPQL